MSDTTKSVIALIIFAVLLGGFMGWFWYRTEKMTQIIWDGCDSVELTATKWNDCVKWLDAYNEYYQLNRPIVDHE